MKGMNRIYKKWMKTCVSMIIISCTLQSCIENDIPYPYINLFITNISADGLIGQPIISNDDRTVTLNFEETVDIKNVLINSITITDGASCTLFPGEYIDLSRSYWVNLWLYQDVQWKIVGNQTIERFFKIDNQVGAETFDLTNKIAYASIVKSENTLLQNQIPKLRELKLGPKGATINNSTSLPSLTWSWERSFWMTTVVVNYDYYETPEEWTLYVFPTSSTAATNSVDAWVNVAWMYGEGLEGGDNGFEMREASSTEWTKVDASYITLNGGSFSARVPHLKAQTSYVCRAYSDENYGSELSFTTGEALELPNGSFDEWHKVGRVWNPWAENGVPIWDTGNDGATTLGESNTQPSSDVRPGAAVGSQSAQLESKFVGIGTIGKFAAGNLFIGEFKKVDGTNGILDFGKPFTARPTKLKGYYKYTTAPINYASSSYQHLKGLSDTCSVYIALGDWSSPVEIRTNPNNMKLFDKNDPNIIAYAEFNSGTTVTEYTPLELELEYRSTSRVPTYIMVVCSASKFGDFFTGGAGATMYVDDFTLEYDY